MMTLPDFREKQILFVETTDLKDISILNSNFTLKKDNKIIQQVPFHKIFAIFLIGNATFTSVFLKKILSYGVTLCLADINLAPYLVLGGEAEGNFLLREKQYLDEKNLEKSKWVVVQKIQNQLSLLQNFRGKSAAQKEGIASIKTLLKKITPADNLDSIRGIEGNAAKIFFPLFFEKCSWRGRKPRTKYDENNVLLDIGYTYLFNFIEAHLRLYGFDIYKGFYHTGFYQRKSLVCDLVEPFRCLIDNALRKCHSLGQFDSKDFVVEKSVYKLKKGCGKKYSRIFLEAITTNKEAMFLFVQQYYRTVMKSSADFPQFKIS